MREPPLYGELGREFVAGPPRNPDWESVERAGPLNRCHPSRCEDGADGFVRGDDCEKFLGPALFPCAARGFAPEGGVNVRQPGREDCTAWRPCCSKVCGPLPGAEDCCLGTSDPKRPPGPWETAPLREEATMRCTRADCSRNDGCAGPGCMWVKKCCEPALPCAALPPAKRPLGERLARVGVTGSAPVIMRPPRNVAASMRS